MNDNIFTRLHVLPARFTSALGMAALFAVGCPTRVVDAAKAIVVSEDRIAVSAPDSQGFTTVYGPPGCIIVRPNAVAAFVLENTKMKPRQQVQGKVNADGGFVARIQARPDDKLRLRLSSSDGGSTKISKRVPLQPITRPPRALSAPNISGNSEYVSALAPRPTPEIVIHYKTSQQELPRAETIENEVLQSGVLPPPQ
jgi:hypothetical protein